MHAAWMWARREIRHGWAALVVVAVLVAITGGAVTAGVAGAHRAGASVDRFVEDSNLPQVTLFADAPLDPGLRADLSADDRVENMIDSQVILATPSELEPGIGGATFVVPDDYLGGSIHLRVIEGRYPSAPDEIALSEKVAAAGYSVGDTVSMHLLTLSRLAECMNDAECAPESIGEATITGVLRLPDDLAPSPLNGGILVAPFSFLEAAGGDEAAFGFITEIHTVDGTDVDAFVTEYSPRVTDGDLLDAHADVADAQRAAELQHDALLIGTAIAAGAGLLIVSQAFGRFLARRGSDAPRLRAIGMTSGQRVIAGWLPGAAGAVTGALGSLPVAFVFSPLFPLRIARRADPDVGFHADWEVFAMSFVGVLAVGLVAALLSAVGWSRPSEAAMPTTVSPVSRLAQQLRLGPAPTMGSGFALEVGRGERRAPVIPALIGTAAALAVIVGGLVVAASIDGLLSSPDRYGAPWDVQVSVGDALEEASDFIVADERVDGVAVAVTGELDLASADRSIGQGFVLGMESIKGSIEPVLLEGRSPVGLNEVTLGSDTLDALGVSVGDRVTVSGPAGEREMVVVGRVIVPSIGTTSTDVGTVLPLQVLHELGGTSTVADIDVASVVLATATNDTDVAAIEHDIIEAGVPLDGPFLQPGVGVLDEVRGIPLYVGVFTASIGLLATFHALFVTGRRRRRDLAVMRALGYRPAQAASVIRWQGFFATLAALVVGIPIGVLGGRLLWETIAERTNVLVAIDTPWIGIALVATVALAISTILLAAGPASTARRRLPANDLRAE